MLLNSIFLTIFGLVVLLIKDYFVYNRLKENEIIFKMIDDVDLTVEPYKLRRLVTEATNIHELQELCSNIDDHVKQNEWLLQENKKIVEQLTNVQRLCSLTFLKHPQNDMIKLRIDHAKNQIKRITRNLHIFEFFQIMTHSLSDNKESIDLVKSYGQAISVALNESIELTRKLDELK